MGKVNDIAKKLNKKTHKYMLIECMHVVTYLTDVSRRRQREGNTANNKAESWQVVELAAVHHVLKIKTTKEILELLLEIPRVSDLIPVDLRTANTREMKIFFKWLFIWVNFQFSLNYYYFFNFLC